LPIALALNVRLYRKQVAEAHLARLQPIDTEHLR